MMQTVICPLAKLCEIDSDDPQAVKVLVDKIHEETGIRKYTLNKLFTKNPVTINIDHVMTRLCGWLVKNKYATASTVFSDFFQFVPDEFSPRLTDRKRLIICTGLRKDRYDDYWYAAADVELQSVLDQKLAASPPLTQSNGTTVGRSIMPHSIIAPDINADYSAAVKAAAKSIYRDYRNLPKNKAIVCLGSIKSNAVTELVLSKYLAPSGAFQTEDDKVKFATERSSPIVFLYRNSDPYPCSPFGGKQLSRTQKGTGPGIYYEDRKGTWHRCPYSESEDAAIVFYSYDTAMNNLQLVLAGYCARSTRALTHWFSDHVDRLGKDVLKKGSSIMGLFIIQFPFPSNGTQTGKAKAHSDIGQPVFELPGDEVTVTPITQLRPI